MKAKQTQHDINRDTNRPAAINDGLGWNAEPTDHAFNSPREQPFLVADAETAPAVDRDRLQQDAELQREAEGTGAEPEGLGRSQAQQTYAGEICKIMFTNYLTRLATNQKSSSWVAHVVVHRPRPAPRGGSFVPDH